MDTNLRIHFLMQDIQKYITQELNLDIEFAEKTWREYQNAKKEKDTDMANKKMGMYQYYNGSKQALIRALELISKAWLNNKDLQEEEQ